MLSISLRSNRPPSSAEREITRVYIDELEEEMGHVKEEIHSIDSAAARLCDTRAVYAFGKEAWMSVQICSDISIASSLPRSSRKYSCTASPPSPSTLPFAGAVGIGSSLPALEQNRQIHTPALVVPYPQYTPQSTKYCPSHTYHNTMSLALSRSGECALSLDINITHPLSFAEVSTHRFFLLAACHSSRWKILHVVFSSAAAETVQAFAVPAGRLPLLQSLSVIRIHAAWPLWQLVRLRCIFRCASASRRCMKRLRRHSGDF
ncbi:hypothetical protein FIBSPDRAFT_511384 [Athelia psychrophila]|uniref:Uncharacterized protein n=1 Tax=Athelia psychrophila TaxID=1759441 RepID=A0A166UZI6_9AGAM|nr:hypothetical protein FIBSPDRAFT_511384 [Fibularhizoctonia sp. CBS 109695]